MQKDTIIGISTLMVVILAVVAYTALRPTSAEAPINTTVSPALGVTGDGYFQNATYYDITAQYASSTPLSGAANASATALMKNFVDNTIAEFKTDGNFDHLTTEDISMMGFDKGRKESLKIVYLESSSARTVSYIYTIYTDTLGAHGNSDFRTFTFDTTTGAGLALADIFVSGANYLDTLSQLARARLPGIIGDRYDMNAIKDGTTPIEENFKNFFFDNHDLVVLFPPYQVAAYSEGPQTLRIPLSLLTNLKSAYK